MAWQSDDFFDRANAEMRRERVDEARAQNEIVAKHEAEQDAIRKESARATAQRANEMLLVDEYRRAGVEPLRTNERGIPTASLALLRQIGWTIEQVGDRNMLIAPPARQTNPGKQRQDYDQNS